jgi:hypothetical protein
MTFHSATLYLHMKVSTSSSTILSGSLPVAERRISIRYLLRNAVHLDPWECLKISFRVVPSKYVLNSYHPEWADNGSK